MKFNYFFVTNMQETTTIVYVCNGKEESERVFNKLQKQRAEPLDIYERTLPRMILDSNDLLYENQNTVPELYKV